MERELIIPAPVLEKNRDQYLEELSKISEAETWVTKHSEIDKNDLATKQYITIKEPQNTEITPVYIFTLGFSIPCLIWMSLFAFLGEPCSVFCSGKKLWDIYEIMFANFLVCGVILCIAFFDAIGNKTFRSIIFFIGFVSGSYIGLLLGGLFV